ncbi:predicted protein [Naegleria gruberi]|uniref:Predicted protein n=1 Tax=Naegleria gruberi TaxID=5762 RepID=D2V3E7_NAEGR|nr:uncharacterized protein NAEGRDRAFT_46379 [Naegleria gruberi]EFC48758.1 predicted protein [Naegleria gruberi]|eukprot:XP_002681502.1 predicted protein [Naegleria gruberi strain NEG-M]
MTKNAKQNDDFVRYAAFDAYVGYASIYKLYEIMSSDDFESWIKSQCKLSNDEAFQVISTIPSNNSTTTTNNNGENNGANDSKESKQSDVLKGKSFTSLKELAKLDPNATDKEREEFLNMRSTFMGMMYGDKTSMDQQVSYAKEKNQARLRKMAHKNSTQRNISSLVDQMKTKKQTPKESTITQNNEQSSNNSNANNNAKSSENSKKSNNANNNKNTNKKKQTNKKKNTEKKYATSNISFQLV